MNSKNQIKNKFRKAGTVICTILLFLFCSTIVLAQEKKVLIIGVDGLMPEGIGLPEMPHVNALYEDGNGFVTYGYTEDLTFSGPSWSAILHGVHRDRHGVDTNQYHGHDFTDYPHLLMRLKDHDPELYTAAFVTWSLLQNNFQTPGGEITGVDELVYYPRQEDGDEKVTDDLVELLQTGDPGAVFYYQNDIDGAGHGYGFSIDVPEYREQLRTTDARIGRILEALGSRTGVMAGEEEWLIILVTDHGGVDTGHSGNLYRQRFISMILSGASVGKDAPGIRTRNVDVAKTVLSYMGVPEAGYADLDGHDLLALPTERTSEIAYETNLLFNGDGEFDRGFIGRELDQAITGWRDQEHTGRWDGYHSMTLIKAPEDVRYIREDGPIHELGSANLFTGGRNGMFSKITQLVDLSDLSEDIDQRGVHFQLSGYLGGTNERDDRMELKVTFLDENGDVIDTAMLDTVTREDRDGETALIYRETEGFVFPGTRSAMVHLYAIGSSRDGVHALADELSITLFQND